MQYDEARVVLSVTPKGRFRTLVGFAGAAPIEDSFVPPEGLDGAALYEEWFDSFKKEPSPDAKRALEERRRKAGEQLFEALFASAAPRILERLNVLDDRFRAGGVGQRGLRVRLLLGDAWGKGKANADAILPVSNLPYELMVPPGVPRFLARRPFVSIVRTIGVAECVGPTAVSGKLQVLVANAQPQGSEPLGWAAEVRKIQSALKARTDIAVKMLENASFEDTCQCLRDGGFHVLHFIGHGGYDRKSGQWYLLFEKERTRQPVLAETIADRLGDIPRLRLAVLNACHSGELAREAGGNPLAGIAAALSVYGLPAVVGMQVAVTDSAAIEFSNAFYDAIRKRESIEAAVAKGRSAINVFSPEWATPVFYLRGETSELFEFEVDVSGKDIEGCDEQVPAIVGYCFVIQPIDGGVFEKRYEDVFAPAIEHASLHAYRIDVDPSVTVVIDEIEKRIRAADVCLAEISTDNPNVWFELGYALACQKEVVLVCDRSLRSRLPFDIQHRSIITYDTHSLRDFENLKAKITKKLQAALAKEKQIEAAAGIPTSTQVGGLAQHEIVALVAVAQNQEILEAGAPAHLVRKDMEKAGFTKIAGTLGLKSIVGRGLVQVHEAYTANEEVYSLYSITNEGYSWLLANQGGLALRCED